MNHARQALAIDDRRYDFRPEVWRDHHEGQAIEQRWFAGVHTNIGGGYVDDGLANVALRWIADGAITAGLNVDMHFLSMYRPYPQDKLYPSWGFKYRLLDTLRLRRDHGVRRLWYPESANLTIDPSVIVRLTTPPERLVGTREAYRPKNVLSFLSCQTDLDGYLDLIGSDPARLTSELRDHIQRAPCQSPYGDDASPSSHVER